VARVLSPTTFEEAATSLAATSAEGQSVRIRGGATKLEWGTATDEPSVELWTSALDQIVEHNAGDLTAIVQAGAPLARVQDELAAEGQMLALDPPLGAPSRKATVGGVFATGDSGPLRHRYGGARDLVLGMTVALSDGTIARSGGKVIKNVAGYDLGKLFTGSFGTLGVILSVSIRLHPLPLSPTTALGASNDPDLLSAAARTLAAAPLELESLDVAWRAGQGGVLARCAGTESGPRSERIAELMRKAGLTHVDIAADDGALWARQRAGQRSREHALVRIAARPHQLPSLLRATQAAGGTLVGRAALGVSFVEVDPDAVATLRDALPSAAVSVVLDAPVSLRRSIDPWGTREGPALELMRRIKGRFDPAQVCNPGLFVGGI
jgi:glycolate dehydrogenase FAD-binding subunit